MHRKGVMDEITFKYLSAKTDLKPGRLYLLPKLHKLDPELIERVQQNPTLYKNVRIHGRPIVSLSGTVLERIGKYLDKFMLPAVVQQETHLRNSLEFINFIEKLHGPDQIKKGKEVIVETSGNGALCSISLTIGEEYVLSGFKTAAGGFRCLASNIVNRVKDLATMPLIRDYLLGTGLNTYKRNCDRGCTDISTKSIHCKIPDPTLTALQCYSNNAICRERYGKCKWLIISLIESYDIRYMDMDYRPRYITGINNDTVAVGCTRYQVIQIIDISKDTIVRTIPTSSECFGISCSEDKLYVDASDIVVMDLYGHVLRTFPNPGVDLGYLTVDGDRFFFCDGFTLFCCDLNGNVKWEFDKEGYKDIYGMATDSKGNVYLANADSDRIVVISPDGRHHKDILTSFDSLESPISIDFDKNENRMVVRTTANESAFIFDVKFKD
ncbi:unnamed protein product [Mytilus coruscus]|uniref:Uncharacterized protein n=1 Tax=Mytilus coruscus TaxID=42192 RepID=A0A6J8BFG7_MYTCO|nr:unnamed protein product [Mytilus coruscus]